MKNFVKSYIINTNIIIFLILTIIFLFNARGVKSAETSLTGDTIFEIEPIYKFKGGRDPFIPRYKKEIIPVIKDIDISTFVLLGITETEDGERAALFQTKSGNITTYIFKDGKLYGDNERIIYGVVGIIKNNKEVLLIQGDKEVLFKLSDEIQGQTIGN